MGGKVVKALTITISIIMVITAFAFLSASVIACHDRREKPTCPEGLVSYWKFDESGGITAYDSADGNDGTIYGATKTTGRVGNALSFDGVDDYVDCGDAPNLRPTEAITIEAWIMTNRIDDEETLENVQTIVCKYCYNGYFLRINPGGKIGFGVSNSQILYRETVNVIQPGYWFHVVGTYDSIEGMNIYINGELKNGGSSQGEITNVNSSLTIGAWTETHTLNFDGIIDEVALYNRALSPEEIALHHNNGLVGKGYFETPPSDDDDETDDEDEDDEDDDDDGCGRCGRHGRHGRHGRRGRRGHGSHWQRRPCGFYKGH